MPESGTDEVFELAVVIYRPRMGNYYHWGLHARSHHAKTHWIFQVEGEPNQLVKVTKRADPAKSGRLVKRIIVGECEEDAFGRVDPIIQAVAVQNDGSSWDCQDYVLDILDELEEDDILGAMPEYDAVKRALKNMRGSIESTHRAVVRYDYARLLEGEDEEDESDEEGEGKDDDQPRNVRSAETVVDSSDDE